LFGCLLSRGSCTVSTSGHRGPHILGVFDRKKLDQAVIPPTTQIENTTTLWNNSTFLVPVCAGVVLVIIVIFIVVRRRSCHRRIKLRNRQAKECHNPLKQGIRFIEKAGPRPKDVPEIRKHAIVVW
ncbi:hypothetical protein MAR_001026, partial [Mya arenaria]